MPGPIFVPPSIRRTRRCERCERWYAKQEPACVHCSRLSDPEVAALKQRDREQDAADDALGRAFLAVGGVLALLVVLALLRL